MNIQNNSPQEQAYGFLCSETNTFYAFQTLEEYESFMFWLQSEKQPEMVPELNEINEDDQIQDYNSVTS